MRIVFLILSGILTMALIVAFNTTMFLPAPLGKLLSPQHGIWQNAEPVDEDFSATLHFPEMEGKATVYFDDRMVPHIFADSDADAFFAQGFIHAKFRLWQMEFQTHAAAGRLTEVLGAKSGTTDLLNVADRYFRRLGMTFAAERSLALSEVDPITKKSTDAYTAGINAYISTLTESSLPLEYKLLGYKPEPWSNLKTALFLKYMSFDLAGGENDFEYTAAKNAFTKTVFDQMYPLAQDTLDPIVPKGTVFEPPLIHPVTPASADSLYFNYKKGDSSLPLEPQKPNPENGSNNWAVAGSKTKSHYPILCNDPHLGLNLPSLWFEMQITTPEYSAYGASFPCSPGVIIGFNDSCAFGFTNAGRDVRDYYKIEFKDDTKEYYRYNNEWVKTSFRYEHFKIKGGTEFIDTVAYTIFGPVIFDDHYSGKSKNKGAYAVRWKAHDPSNDLRTFLDLDKARNYVDYIRAVKNLHTPGQNVVFASKSGDIAMRAQGEFPAKWRRQGDFVMPGTDSSYQWQGMIPVTENPRMFNPVRGFVSSANQFPADSTYPYYLGGGFTPYRGIIINRLLAGMENITPKDMMILQNNNYDLFAELARPIFINAIPEERLSSDEKYYWDMLKSWNLNYETGAKGATVFYVIFDNLEAIVWDDELKGLPNAMMPYESTLIDGIIRDSAYQFLDNINTAARETLTDDLLEAIKKAVPVLKKAEADNRLDWAKFKDTRITHLTRLMELSRTHLNAAGGTHAINSTKTAHGPSWRMVVHLSPETEAYGVYPGGQSGHPGSKYYDTFVDTWAKGDYYPLVMMKNTGPEKAKAKFTMLFEK